MSYGEYVLLVELEAVREVDRSGILGAVVAGLKSDMTPRGDMDLRISRRDLIELADGKFEVWTFGERLSV